MASLLTRGLQSLSLLGPAMVRFAGKKAGGTGGVSRSSNPKYMGIKVHGDQFVKAGGIIYRQRGAKFHPGENVIIGRDYTISAKIEGWVEFTKKKIRNGMRRHHWVQYINVRPGTREEHRERVRARVHARNNKPMSNRLWTLTQMGHFADRGEPASAASS